MPALWTSNVGPDSKKPSLWKPQAEEPANVKNDSEFLSPGPRQNVRRLSSNIATFNDLSLGPAVVVPPKDIQKPSDAHETAAALELAKFRLSTGAGSESPRTPPTTSVTSSYAFGFDIDGVLIRGGKPIPAAIEAMKVLNGQNEHGIKVPYIFLTNGGGKSEEERCIQLSKQLELEISPGQFICGHTPMKEMADKYQTVLVVGGQGEKCREVAEEYGFKDVVTPGDIIKYNSRTTPFRKLTDQETKSSRSRNFSKVEINAIFVFADSLDWAGDQQIIIDLLTSQNGRLGTKSENGTQDIPIYFSHNDIVWATEHEQARLGMGALRTSIEAIYESISGKPLVSTAFGKPQIGTFAFATRLLQQWRKDTHRIDKPPETVYFIGDTPGSDIRGTNEYNESSESNNDWYSILVRTGVYKEGTNPIFTPRATVDNVLDAVKHGMQREWNKTHNKEVDGQNLANGEKVIPENGVEEATKDVDGVILKYPAKDVQVNGEKGQ